MSKTQAAVLTLEQAGVKVAEVIASATAEAAQNVMATDHKDPFHVSVTTRIPDKDVVVDSRVCDIYNFQSRKWLTNHQFWAMHQGHTVEIHPATDDEVGAYTSKQAQLLSRRYGK